MEKLFAKYTPGEPLDLRKVDTANGAYVTELRESGFLDFVASVQPDAQPGCIVVEHLEVVGGKIVQTWSQAEEATTDE